MRVGYNTKPYEKHMEVYQNFSGGLNTVSPPDGMLDSELTDMLNQDISERGSLKRRHGLRKLRTNSLPSGMKQGYFRYYKTDGTFDELFAVGGNLYKNESNTKLTISGAGDLGGYYFQNTRPIEAVQMDGKLYIASGSGFLYYDGTNCGRVSPYLPTTMEMLYIGSNGLAYEPEGHLQDSVGLVASIDFVLPVKVSLVVNKPVEAKVFCTKITGETYEYSMDIRPIKKQGEVWEDATSWKTLTDNKFAGPKASVEGDYELRIQMRKTGTTEILSESITQITVDLTYQFKDSESNLWLDIARCNRILLHWGRIFLYGDSNNPATVYMSHLNQPDYFPALMNIVFDSPRREGITTIVHYRNSLVVFTKSSTQALYGTNPEDYRRVMLHTDLGCISPFGAAVMKNHIGFVSSQGIYALKTMGLTDDKATVEKLDVKIGNIVPKDDNALVVFTDGQLQVTYPSSKQRFRFYHDLGAWTKDYSDTFDFSMQYNIDGDIYCLGGSNSPNLYVFDRSIYQDDTYVYENYWETKYLNFGQPYHKKKLKELQILSNPKDEPQTCTVYVYADEQAVITPDHSYASVVGGAVVWNVVIEPNFHVSGGSTFDEKWILGDSVLGKNVFSVEKLRLTGKCLRTRIRMSNTEPKENHFMGFAYIFKVKKA